MAFLYQIVVSHYIRSSSKFYSMHIPNNNKIIILMYLFFIKLFWKSKDSLHISFLIELGGCIFITFLILQIHKIGSEVIIVKKPFQILDIIRCLRKKYCSSSMVFYFFLFLFLFY